jgi:hypothetical protein
VGNCSLSTLHARGSTFIGSSFRADLEAGGEPLAASCWLPPLWVPYRGAPHTSAADCGCMRSSTSPSASLRPTLTDTRCSAFGCRCRRPGRTWQSPLAPLLSAMLPSPLPFPRRSHTPRVHPSRHNTPCLPLRVEAPPYRSTFAAMWYRSNTTRIPRPMHPRPPRAFSASPRRIHVHLHSRVQRCSSVCTRRPSHSPLPSLGRRLASAERRARGAPRGV